MNDRSSSLNCVYTDCFTKVKWINYGHCNVWHKCWSKGQCRIELYYDTMDNIAQYAHYGKWNTLFDIEFRWLHTIRIILYYDPI